MFDHGKPWLTVVIHGVTRNHNNRRIPKISRMLRISRIPRIPMIFHDFDVIFHYFDAISSV